MVDRNKFPNLCTYQTTSPATIIYNCIAWAAEDTQRFWWPDPSLAYYWPPSVPREETIIRFIEAFRALGYNPCDDGSLESGWQKVVIYADSLRKPKHMARQLSNGFWTSKMGRDLDITHNRVEDLEGPFYGSVVQYLRRRFS